MTTNDYAHVVKY